ncbi:hypothetical protein V8C26DRAFT_426907 [Trichoderma gracile]
MARPQNLKRQRAPDCSEEKRPQKRTKSTRERGTAWNHPPRFYDNLSKVWLTRLALKELDRRNSIAAQSKPSGFAGDYSRDLARFARHGGPDLCHLRGYPERSGVATMASRSSASSSLRRTQSTKGTTLTTKRLSAKSKNFEQHLNDHGIYLDDGKSEARNIDEIRDRLARRRPSLSPSRFSDGQFAVFRRANRNAVSEHDVMTKVIPTICGNTDIHSQQNILFTELLPITTEDATKPQPDLFDGAHIHELDMGLRADVEISPMILPSKHKNVPVATNFFLEAKGPNGNAVVMQRQACYDGAYGARAMHSLQNYNEEEPEYDGNACTFSSTYHAATGTLQLYSHHITAPVTPGARPEYYMTEIDGSYLTGSREGFLRGARLLRNARDLAKEFRDRFIRVANARARGDIPPVTQDTLASTEALPDSALSPNVFFDCQELPESQNSHNTIAVPSICQGSDGLAPENGNADLATYLNDDQQDNSQDSVSLGAADQQTSLVTSFTSSFRSGTDPRGSKGDSKRSRNPNSPPTSHPKKFCPGERIKVDSGKGKDKASSSDMPDDNDGE